MIRTFLVLGLSLGTATAASAQSLAQPGFPSTLRQIADPQAGIQWRLSKNLDHPSGPGQWVAVHEASAKSPTFNRETANALKTSRAPLAPVIRAGDAVIVDDDSDVARVRLEAVAMMPAAAGAAIRVRLRTAVTVNAIAIGSGRARLAPQFKRQP